MDRKAVRRTCLSFKGATMDHPWDPKHDAFKIGGKIFAVISSNGGLIAAKLTKAANKKLGFV